MSLLPLLDAPKRGRGRPRQHPPAEFVAAMTTIPAESCNPKSKKANNPAYFCNEETHRWKKAVALIGPRRPGKPRGRPAQEKKEVPSTLQGLVKNAGKNCDPMNWKAYDPAYFCNEETSHWKKIAPAPKTKKPVGRPRQNNTTASVPSASGKCNPLSWKAASPAYFCNDKTGLWKKVVAAPVEPKRPVGRPRKNPVV